MSRTYNVVFNVNVPFLPKNSSFTKTKKDSGSKFRRSTQKLSNAKSKNMNHESKPGNGNFRENQMPDVAVKSAPHSFIGQVNVDHKTELINWSEDKSKSRGTTTFNGSSLLNLDRTMRLKQAGSSVLGNLKLISTSLKGKRTIEAIAIAIAIGLIVIAATHGIALATLVLAILPTLCIGIWIAYRVPQKIDVSELKKALSQAPGSTQISTGGISSTTSQASLVRNFSYPSNTFRESTRSLKKN